MQKRIALDGGVCRITGNGDLSFGPAFVAWIDLPLAGAVLAGVWFWLSGLRSLAALLFLATGVVALVKWFGPLKVRVAAGSGVVAWRRGLRSRRCLFGEIARVNVALNRREYAWSAHLVERRKEETELQARLELILKDGDALFLGSLSGKYAGERLSLLAQSVARVVGAPVSIGGVNCVF